MRINSLHGIKSNRFWKLYRSRVYLTLPRALGHFTFFWFYCISRKPLAQFRVTGSLFLSTGTSIISLSIAISCADEGTFVGVFGKKGTRFSCKCNILRNWVIWVRSCTSLLYSLDVHPIRFHTRIAWWTKRIRLCNETRIDGDIC